MADRRILLVEDDVLIGMMLADMFDALGYPEPAQAASVLISKTVGQARSADERAGTLLEQAGRKAWIAEIMRGDRP